MACHYALDASTHNNNKLVRLQQDETTTTTTPPMMMMCACGCGKSARESTCATTQSLVYNAKLIARALVQFQPRIAFKSFQCLHCPAFTCTTETNPLHVVRVATLEHCDDKTASLRCVNDANVHTRITLLSSSSSTTEGDPTAALWISVSEFLGKLPLLVDQSPCTITNLRLIRGACFRCMRMLDEKTLRDRLVRERLLPYENPSPELIAELFPDHPRAFEFLGKCAGAAGIIRAVKYMPPSSGGL
jgi:hypothetical protein